MFERNNRGVIRGKASVARMLSAVAALLVLTGATAWAQGLDTVVEDKSDAPEAGSTYRSFFRPTAVDAVNQPVIFEARLRALGGSTSGLFVEDTVTSGGSGSTVALRGGLTPIGGVYRRFSRAAGNIFGDFAWQARLSGGTTGVFRTVGATTVAVATVGDAVPLPGSGLMDRLSHPQLTDLSDAVFHSTISGGAVVGGVPVNEGIFRCGGGDGDCHTGTGTMQTLALIQDVAGGRSICDFYDNSMAASSWGVTFRAETRVVCSNAAEVPLDAVIRLQFGGVLELVALVGDPANPSPGAGGTVYSELDGRPDIEDTGVVAFIGHVIGLRDDEVLFRCDPATCPLGPAESVVIEGDADALGNTVNKAFQSAGVANNGDLSFHASGISTFGKRRAGVYRVPSGGQLEIIAVKGDAVPNAAVASTYRKIGRSNTSVNGRIAFSARIKRSAGGGGKGIYVFEP